MDHGHMDHGHGDMDHGDMDMNMCNMNMLFTWDTTNLCIVFKEWRVTGTLSLVWSLLGVVVLTAGYELVRELSRRYEAKSAVTRGSDGSNALFPPASEGSVSPETPDCIAPEKTAAEWRLSSPKKDPDYDESSSLLSPGRLSRQSLRRDKIIKASLYAVQVFYSFFIMLLFMTYNGWIMLAVAVGAFVGYIMFGQSSPTKSVACH